MPQIIKTAVKYALIVGIFRTIWTFLNLLIYPYMSLTKLTARAKYDDVRQLVKWLWRPWYYSLPWHRTLHISEFKYALTHGTFPIFFGNWQNRAYSLQIYDYLRQIQRETKAFRLIVRHNTEGPPFSDWQWRHRTLFFFVGLKNRVNLALFIIFL